MSEYVLSMPIDELLPQQETESLFVPDKPFHIGHINTELMDHQARLFNIR